MPYRWISEAMRVAWSWLGDLLAGLAALFASLVAVEHFGPHLAVLLITVAEVFVGWVALPRPQKVRGEFSPDELDAYRRGRQKIIRDRRMLLVLWLGVAFMLVVLVNAGGDVVPLPPLDVYFSVGVCTALVIQAIVTAQRAQKLLAEPLGAVKSLLPLHLVSAEAPPTPSALPGGVIQGDDAPRLDEATSEDTDGTRHAS